jgi:predicted NodU family carbamoyl transferase
MKDKLNSRVKHRQAFRPPFAAFGSVAKGTGLVGREWPQKAGKSLFHLFQEPARSLTARVGATARKAS